MWRWLHDNDVDFDTAPTREIATSPDRRARGRAVMATLAIAAVAVLAVIALLAYRQLAE